jgi:hypothetical protein
MKPASMYVEADFIAMASPALTGRLNKNARGSKGAAPTDAVLYDISNSTS